VRGGGQCHNALLNFGREPEQVQPTDYLKAGNPKLTGQGGFGEPRCFIEPFFELPGFQQIPLYSRRVGGTAAAIPGNLGILREKYAFFAVRTQD